MIKNINKIFLILIFVIMNISYSKAIVIYKVLSKTTGLFPGEIISRKFIGLNNTNISFIVENNTGKKYEIYDLQSNKNIKIKRDDRTERINLIKNNNFIKYIHEKKKIYNHPDIKISNCYRYNSINIFNFISSEGEPESFLGNFFIYGKKINKNYNCYYINNIDVNKINIIKNILFIPEIDEKKLRIVLHFIDMKNEYEIKKCYFSDVSIYEPIIIDNTYLIIYSARETQVFRIY